MREFANGIDVVVDYLWSESARTIIAAIAKSVEDATPFVSCMSAAQVVSRVKTCQVQAYVLPQLCSWGAGSKAYVRQVFLKQSRACSKRPSLPNCRSQRRPSPFRKWKSIGTQPVSREWSSRLAESPSTTVLSGASGGEVSIFPIQEGLIVISWGSQIRKTRSISWMNSQNAK